MGCGCGGTSKRERVVPAEEEAATEMTGAELATPTPAAPPATSSSANVAGVGTIMEEVPSR